MTLKLKKDVIRLRIVKDMSILQDIDEAAASDAGRKGEIRQATIDGAVAVAKRDGDFDSGRIRDYLESIGKGDLVGPQSGACISGMLRRGRIKDTGRTAPSNNYRSGNVNRKIPVYVFVDGVQDE